MILCVFCPNNCRLVDKTLNPPKKGNILYIYLLAQSGLYLPLCLASEKQQRVWCQPMISCVWVFGEIALNLFNWACHVCVCALRHAPWMDAVVVLYGNRLTGVLQTLEIATSFIAGGNMFEGSLPNTLHSDLGVLDLSGVVGHGAGLEGQLPPALHLASRENRSEKRGNRAF